jgi:hypothetical protein
MAALDEGASSGRRQRHPLLARLDLAGHADDHAAPPLAPRARLTAAPPRRPIASGPPSVRPILRRSGDVVKPPITSSLTSRGESVHWTDMLTDPGFWLFGLAIGLLSLGILGVVLSTRRVPPSDLSGAGSSLTELGSDMARLHALEAEVERLRAERDELRGILGRLATLLERRVPPRPPDRRPQLVATGDDRERRAGGG